MGAQLHPRTPLPIPQQLLRNRTPGKQPWSITDLTVHTPSTASPASSSQHGSQPRWRTKEFYVYYLVFAVVVPQMWRIGCKATRATGEGYWKYVGRLRNGWLFGWKVDVTDAQYYLFRSKLPLLVALMLFHLSLSHSFRFFSARLSPSHNPSSPHFDVIRARDTRAAFGTLFSVALLTVLHGSSLPKLLIILGINYRIAMLGAPLPTLGGPRRWRREWTPYATWAFNVAILLANEVCSGYKWGSLNSAVSWLDDYGGLLPRWHISYNISMLRLVSFNMEYYWAWSAKIAENEGDVGEGLPEPPTSPRVKAAQQFQSAPRTSSSTAAPDPSPSVSNYTFIHFTAYVLYPPLYLAGPIMTYPSFLAQLAPAAPPTSTGNGASTPVMELAADPFLLSASSASLNRLSTPLTPSETSPRALLSYTIRFLSCLLTMELLLHSMYVVALKDSGKGWWNGMTPAEVSMVGFWNLIVVWLKLLLPWRLFRLWALLDGIVPPENMIRCMANNYSTLGFWRSWHRSYNMWVVRYLYIPLGGSARPLLATLGVFTFVALWHDLRLRLLIWGWGVTLFVMPEMIARKAVPHSKYGSKPWYRHLAALGGVANVLLMMTANLVGFVVGVDGAKELWKVMLGGWEGRLFLLFASACLFVAVQVMFEYREEERRRGISRKC
ncbi:glycerol:H+ symporter Gup1 [Rhodotorula toruloides]|uniref:Glycerol:H+ symporter Gup1 n=1 Tax=Rhodotorula toruloides TaxID=5286 RepID=A0A511KPM4_RHOTO|nr:glycerol:H+ symporter Gup1 [Rhodotorula toruloides]